MKISGDRRQNPRFTVPSMYSKVMVRLLDEEDFTREGHAYDISAGGVRFELDGPIEAGTPIAMRIDLPHSRVERSTEWRDIFAFANVVWVEWDDAPGPYRLAAVFTEFPSIEDAHMLDRRLCAGAYSAAA